MRNETLARFIESYCEDIIDAMHDADEPPVNGHYRLGVRRLASAFFHKFNLFELQEVLPHMRPPDVDAWFEGRPESTDDSKLP
ncbi:MAG TPA: hypothetical protein VJM15_07290 [Sphingomicrobium sp.]|nr:hypothetical protein [Sphingomicrobium sp.]